MSDHEYGQSGGFSTPQSLPPSSVGSASSVRRAIYLTPSSSSGGQVSSASSAGRVGVRTAGSVGAGPSGIILMPQVKTEARRRLNLDAAPVDPEGFKTPQKSASKRRVQDLSSPSPKKSKYVRIVRPYRKVQEFIFENCNGYVANKRSTDYSLNFK